MEVNAISPNTDAFYYTSAPTSPRRCNFNGFYFLSMPTSPTRQSSRDLYGFKSESRTPETTQNSPPFSDYFEFDGSKRFYPSDNGFENSSTLSIAYADELFSNGKVLPLRPPPRAQAQYLRPKKTCGISSTASSPGARSSMLRVPFFRQRSLWNDGFDPFVAALNKVKEENDNYVVSTKIDKAQLRRSKSLSPFRWPNGSAKWATHNNKRMGLSPQKDGFGPMIPDIVGPKFGPREDVGRSESRRQKIKKFLMKNASYGGEKRDQKTPLLLRKMHDSGRNSNAITRISKEMKNIMKHRARVFFCLVKGFGIKSCKKSEMKL